MELRTRFLPILKRYTPLLLFGLNLLLSWRLLKTEYLSDFGSIEPFFYALAKHIQRHWWNPGWWPLWNCGMPFRYAYQPLLHYIVAAAANLTGFSAARSFHVVLALFYSAGPVTLFFMACRLSRSYPVALSSALLYSLCSPSAWLMPDIAKDLGGLLLAQRLHAAVSYGDGPYVSGLTLIPLALLLLDRAVERPSILRLLLAALGSIAVALVNIPAAITFTFIIFSYALAAPSKLLLRTIGISAGACLLGYLLVAPLMPLSGLLLTARNAQWMDSGAAMSTSKALILFLGLTALFAASRLMIRVIKSSFVRFSFLFLFLIGLIVLGNDWAGISILAQSKRFHLALEMAAALSLAATTMFVRIRSSQWRCLATVAASVFMVWQIREYRLYAKKLIRPAVLEGRSEQRIAEWFQRAPPPGVRVMVPGSVSFWLNALTPTPQSDGCCDQNLLFQAPRITKYLMGTDDGAGIHAAEYSILWLKTLGVKYVAVCGLHSTEVFHSIHHPHKFDGVLRERWREGDDVIFELSGAASSSLAHWIEPGGVIDRMPVNGIDVAPLRKYVASLESAGSPPDFTWLGTDTAVVQGEAHANQLLSIQIPYHDGWRAKLSAGQEIPVGRDAFGFLLLQPRCSGTCSVALRFDGGVEEKVLQAVRLSTWVLIAAAFLFSRYRSRVR